MPKRSISDMIEAARAVITDHEVTLTYEGLTRTTFSSTGYKAWDFRVGKTFVAKLMLPVNRDQPDYPFENHLWKSLRKSIQEARDQGIVNYEAKPTTTETEETEETEETDAEFQTGDIVPCERVRLVFEKEGLGFRGKLLGYLVIKAKTAEEEKEELAKFMTDYEVRMSGTKKIMIVNY